MLATSEATKHGVEQDDIAALFKGSSHIVIVEFEPVDPKTLSKETKLHEPLLPAQPGMYCKNFIVRGLRTYCKSHCGAAVDMDHGSC